MTESRKVRITNVADPTEVVWSEMFRCLGAVVHDADLQVFCFDYVHGCSRSYTIDSSASRVPGRTCIRLGLLLDNDIILMSMLLQDCRICMDPTLSRVCRLALVHSQQPFLRPHALVKQCASKHTTSALRHSATRRFPLIYVFSSYLTLRR